MLFWGQFFCHIILKRLFFPSNIEGKHPPNFRVTSLDEVSSSVTGASLEVGPDLVPHFFFETMFKVFIGVSLLVFQFLYLFFARC